VSTAGATVDGGPGVRRQLATLVAVTMSLVLLAFLVPLGIVLRGAAADRAIAAATQEAQAMAAMIAADPDAADLYNGEHVVSGLAVSVFMPDGTVNGQPAPRTESIDLASRGQAFTASSDGGVEALVPVQGLPEGTAVVRAYASPALLHDGVARTWALLVALGLALLVLGLLLADRLGQRLVGSVTRLAATADRLADGDLAARASLDGPRELRRVGGELNRLASRISELLVAEREEVADLAHRLRTPVTALRLDAEAVDDPEDRQRFAGDVDHLARIVDEVIRTARRPVREGVGARADLGGVVAQRIAFWSPLAEDDGRPIESVVPAGPVLVRCSEVDLGAAVDALIQNVFAHTPDGTAMRVEVTARIDGGGVLVVADDGPGFPDSASPDGAMARGTSGTSTGLGLDIARRTAEASGGSMRIARTLHSPRLNAAALSTTVPLAVPSRATEPDAETTVEFPLGGAVVSLTFGPPTDSPTPHG
jgi:signal transduction histidine kinase